MADFRHESKFRDRFVRRTIEHALPGPDWWRVRIEDLGKWKSDQKRKS